MAKLTVVEKLTGLDLVGIARQRFNTDEDFLAGIANLERTIAAGVLKRVGNDCLVLANCDMSQAKLFKTHTDRFKGVIMDSGCIGISEDAVVAGTFMRESVICDAPTVVGCVLDNSSIRGTADVRNSFLGSANVYSGNVRSASLGSPSIYG